MRRASERAGTTFTVLLLVALVMLLGAATLPRQLGLLQQALGPSGRMSVDIHHEALHAGLTRVIWLDRLVPPPTVAIAGWLLALAAEPLLAYAQGQRARVRAVITLGLAPLVVQRAGELALSYILSAPSDPTPGLAVGLPQRLATGPALLWSGTVPAWIEALSARANLVTLWCAGIWAAGLRQLDGGTLRAWHVALPAACLAAAGSLTWSLGPSVLALILGRP
ncbi:MAG: hypothetical protein HY560_02990 [Gemmatimonadetes bacterium]|nr:hypothetical protein [Gemmatimonadota bacterium]